MCRENSGNKDDSSVVNSLGFMVLIIPLDIDSKKEVLPGHLDFLAKAGEIGLKKAIVCVVSFI